MKNGLSLKSLKYTFMHSRIFMFVLMAITAVGITTTAIVFKQKFFIIMPLYISLFVMLLQSEALRIAPLIGGLNCILYSIVYYYYALYGSMISTIAMSFPLQILTFIFWSKRKSGATTVFRKLSAKARIILYSSVAIAYVPYLIINIHIGTKLAPIDSMISILGFVNPILMLLAYTDYSYLTIFGTILTSTLYVFLAIESPEQWCYFIYAVYSCISCIRGALNVREIYKKQEQQRGECENKQKAEDSQ